MVEEHSGRDRSAGSAHRAGRDPLTARRQAPRGRIVLARSGFHLIIPSSCFKSEVVGDGFHGEGRLGIHDDSRAVADV